MMARLIHTTSRRRHDEIAEREQPDVPFTQWAYRTPHGSPMSASMLAIRAHVAWAESVSSTFSN